jgi:hypothetical protein
VDSGWYNLQHKRLDKELGMSRAVLGSSDLSSF